MIGLRESTRILAVLLGAGLFLAAFSGAEAATPAPTPPAAPSTAKPAAPHAGRSEAVAESLFTALRRHDYAGAVRLFDDRMKAAVPQAKLQSLWDDQLAPLGSLVSWEQTAGEPQKGLEVRLASLKFERGELKAMVAVDPATGSVAGFFVRPASPPPAPAAAYVDSTKFRAVEMSVGSDSLPLGGTLTLPVGPGPFPAAVLVHGSGPLDRDETVGANRVFRDIAEGLSSRGIAVLRYDKRTLRYPEKMKHPTIDDEVVLDAVSAVASLRAKPEIDPRRIVVIGHSLGALLAPEIAVRSAPTVNVAGVALLAPPGRPPWDIVIAQMRYLEAPAADIADAERKVALMKKGSLGKETFGGVPQTYWLDWGRRDGVAMARRLGRPVLVLHGERDFQVGEEDVAAWRKGLSGLPGVDIRSFSGLNHLFIRGTGKPGLAEYDVPSHVDPGVIDALAAFAASQSR